MSTMIPIMFSILGTIFLIFGSVVMYKKNIKLVPNMTPQKLKKIKNPNKLAEDYSRALIFMSCACFISGLALKYFPGMGMVFGIVLVMAASVYMNRIIAKVDENIKNKVY